VFLLGGWFSCVEFDSIQADIRNPCMFSMIAKTMSPFSCVERRNAVTGGVCGVRSTYLANTQTIVYDMQPYAWSVVSAYYRECKRS
jgi:hypothetical protein